MAKDLVKQIEKQIVHTESLFAVDDSFNDERFMKVRVAVMHTGVNRNNSRFSKETIEKSKSTFANIPILAEVQKFTDENGNEYLDYTTHAMHLEDDAFNEDTQRMIYDEKVVGVIPETNNFELVLDEETDNYYAYCDALLYRDYGNYVCDILENKGGITDVSAEILCDDCSFSAKDKCLDVGTMIMNGVTLLGEAVTPGMAKAHAEVFSIQEDNKQNQLIAIMQELTTALANYTAVITANTNTKGGTEKEMNLFEELMGKYNKTIEDITFEYEGLTDEELKDAFAKAFDEQPVKKIEDDDSPVVVEEETPDVEGEETASEPVTASEEPMVEDEVEQTSDESIEDQSSDDEADDIDNSATFSLGSKTYAVSLSDIMYALSQLVNDTYADEYSWYSVEVYADEKYVIMQDWCAGKAYKQSYKVKKDSYSLVGDRIPVKAVYVTEDEEKELDKMRSNYAEISEKLAKYETEPEKIQILESADYSSVADKEEFIELKKQENHFDLSVDELKVKADEIILSYAKKGALTFAYIDEVEEKKSIGMKKFPTTKKTIKRGRYGGLGKKED